MNRAGRPPGASASASAGALLVSLEPAIVLHIKWRLKSSHLKSTTSAVVPVIHLGSIFAVSTSTAAPTLPLTLARAAGDSGAVNSIDATLSPLNTPADVCVFLYLRFLRCSGHTPPFPFHAIRIPPPPPFYNSSTVVFPDVREDRLDGLLFPFLLDGEFLKKASFFLG